MISLIEKAKDFQFSDVNGQFSTFYKKLSCKMWYYIYRGHKTASKEYDVLSFSFRYVIKTFSSRTGLEHFTCELKACITFTILSKILKV